MPTKEKTPGVVAGKNSFLDLCTNNSKKVIIATVILVGAALAALGGVWSIYKDYNPDLLAVVGGEKIVQRDLNKAIFARDFSGSIEQPSKVDDGLKTELVNQLVENKIYELNARKLGVTVTSKEVTDDLNARNIGYNLFPADKKEVAEDSARAKLTKQKVDDKVFGWKEGEYILFRFDKYYDYGTGSKLVGLNDQNLIKEQKDHAKTLVDQISADLISKKMSFSGIGPILDADPLISAKAFDPVKPNIHDTFEKDEYLSGRNYFDNSLYKGMKEGIANLKTGEISKPVLIQANVNGQFKDIAYAIVKIDNAKVGTSDNSAQWLDSQKKELNVQFYGKYLTADTAKAAVALADSVGCQASYSGSERTDLKVSTFYRGPLGDDIAYGNIKLKINVGGTNLFIYNSTCSSYTASGDAEKSSRADGVMDSASRTYVTAYGTYPAMLVNCGGTSAVIFYMPDTPPAINETSGGSWQFINNDATDNQYFVSTLTGNKDYTGFSTAVKLNLGPWGSPASYANGHQVAKRVRWVPNWKRNLNTGIQTDTNYDGVYEPNSSGGTVTADGVAASLNCPSGPCSVSNLSLNAKFNLTAHNNPGYEFVSWEGEKVNISGVPAGTVIGNQTFSSTANPLSVTLDFDHNVTARFRKIDTPVPTPVPTLSCTLATPANGETPLAVRFTFDSFSGDGTKLPVYFRSGETAVADIPGRYSPYVYTYATEGSYQPKISQNGTTWVNCPSSGITVINPSNPNGGEKPPTN